MATDQIQPALTAEEWAYRTYVGHDVDRHALAALALHGQLFGFREDELRALADVIDVATDPGQYDLANNTLDDCCGVGTVERARAAIAKIAALLPPIA